jgi:hypothetical protein
MALNTIILLGWSERLNVTIPIKINLNTKIELQISQSSDSQPTHTHNIIVNVSNIKLSFGTHSHKSGCRDRPIRGGAVGHDRFVF